MGSIYAIDHNGDLFSNRHANPDATGPLAHPGLGERIGSGWGDVPHVAAMRLGDQTVIAGVGPKRGVSHPFRARLCVAYWNQRSVAKGALGVRGLGRCAVHGDARRSLG